MLDKIIYRVLTGTKGSFTFKPNTKESSGFEGISSVGIYVHIPFCRSLCSFCPYAKVMYRDELAKAYTRALNLETERILQQFTKKMSVSSVYFGGGTPLTAPYAIKTVMEKISPFLEKDAVIGIELHPNDVTNENIAFLKGFTEKNVMISLGVESLSDKTLEYLNRGYDKKKALKSLETILNAHFHCVNTDLMIFLPDQSPGDISQDILDLMDMGTDQISAYPLMDFSYTEPKTPYSIRSQRKILRSLGRIGADKGYERSSVWTWTKPCKDVYSSITRDEFIGVGASAASVVGGEFSLNTFHVPSYIESKGHATALHTHLSPIQSDLYRLFWHCYRGSIHVEDFSEIKNLPKILSLCRKLGLVHGSQKTYRLDEKALLLYHTLERYYTRKYIGRLWSLCREKPFPDEITL